ncbi:MAG: ABC transporter ATP-binding protein [Roseiflexaceae bacterium]|nr:ABC transporter ATP-binding protein [Roseiflexaceae bacterium]
MTAIVELRNVSRRFGQSSAPALDGLSLEVLRGEIMALLGPSGCGKSTTLRLIAGLEQPDDGEIWLNGAMVASPRHSAPPEARGIGMVFQDYALFPHLTVLENVAFGLHRLPKSQRHARAAQALALVGLGEFGARYAHQLSGGQQQRVALARALAPRPAVVLLDEPFSNLDAALRVQMRDDLRDILRRAEATAIFVTHDQAEALALGDRVALLRAGRLEQVGRPDELFQRPRTRFVAEFMGAADFVPAQVVGGVLLTELGRVDQALPLPDGTQLDLLVRFDDLELLPQDHGCGVIVGRTYEGPSFMYLVEMESGLRLRCQTSHICRYQLGDRVCVDLRHDHALVAFVDGLAI